MSGVGPVSIDFTEQDIDTVLASVRESLATGQLSQGRVVAAFEAELAAFTGSAHAVAVSTGTAALVCGLRALTEKGREAGEVLVPANTFYATAVAPILAGLRTRLVDVDPDTLAPAPETLAAAVTPQTVGVLQVHMGGIISPATARIQQWCTANGLWLFEDCAHAHGSRAAGRHAGTWGRAGAFSFFATKVLTCGEGGAVITEDGDLADRLRVYRNLGKPHAWRSYHTLLGDNARMSELHAAVGRTQLARAEEFVDTRTALARRYTAALAGSPLAQPVLPAHDRASWYKYVLLLDEAVDRDRLRTAMAEEDVRLGGEIYELPLNRQPAFAGRIPPGRFPVAERLCARHICLPLHTRMTTDDVDLVVDVLNRALGRAGRLPTRKAAEP